MRRPNTATNITAENYNYNVCTTLYNTPLMMYYDSNGVLKPYFSVAYGIYATATSTTFSNTSNATPTLTIKSPSWNARCHTTYFSVNRAPELDPTNSNIRMRCDIYCVRAGSTLNMFYRNVIDLYNHPLT